MNELHRQMNQGRLVLLLLDFTAVFNKVDHNSLIYCLTNTGIHVGSLIVAHIVRSGTDGGAGREHVT